MIVIGGSLGGMDALGEVLRALPAGFPLPIAVVLHRHKESVGMMLDTVQRSSALPVREVADKDPIVPGMVYLCPPDYHLLVDDGYFSLSTDEPVNFARPSVDVLFESAAASLRKRVIAVVLSGAGSDGSNAVAAVVGHGGAVIVQEPSTAQGPWMPMAAIAAAPACRVLTPKEIAAELVRFARLRGGQAQFS